MKRISSGELEANRNRILSDFESIQFVPDRDFRKDCEALAFDENLPDEIAQDFLIGAKLRIPESYRDWYDNPQSAWNGVQKAAESFNTHIGDPKKSSDPA